MSNHSNRGGTGSSDWLMGAVKNNPEGLLLMAAGCALLMRSSSLFGGSGSSQRSSSAYQPSHQGSRGESYQGSRGEGHTSRSGVADGINRTVEGARDYASDMGRTVSDTASQYASAVGEYADQAKRSIIEGSERLAGQTQSALQSTADRVLRDQPLAVAIAGLAAGALVAAAFPSTSIERQTLGPAAKRLSEAAAEAGQNLQQAASAAGERLMNAADERGLSASGLKEMASEAAGAFGSAFSGEKQDKTAGGGSGSGGGTSSSGGSQSTEQRSSSRGTSSGQLSGGSSSGTSSSGGSQSSEQRSGSRGTSSGGSSGGGSSSRG